MTFDDNIDCHTNRYVISAEKGNAMHQELQTTYRGTLLNYSHSVNAMKTKFNGMIGFFNDVRLKSNSLGKIMIYCDRKSFLEQHTLFFENFIGKSFW